MSEKQRNDWMEEANQIAAQCWCDPETENKEMDVTLAGAVARRIAFWMETAAQNERNSDYYRGLLVECGEAIGHEAFVQDDGGISEDVLCAKVPELVRGLTHTRKALKDFREEVKEVVDGLDVGYCGTDYAVKALSAALNRAVKEEKGEKQQMLAEKYTVDREEGTETYCLWEEDEVIKTGSLDTILETIRNIARQPYYQAAVEQLKRDEAKARPHYKPTHESEYDVLADGSTGR